MNTSKIDSFSQLGLSEKLQNRIQKLGYEKPTQIQQQAIPALLKGQDVIGIAKTGTGKTAAFALPLIDQLKPSKKPQLLCLTPTRELALQVAAAFSDYSQNSPHKVTCVYGGEAISKQLQALRQSPSIIVGTPGRVMDLIKRNKLDISAINNLVLDEADEMLRMGFIDDVEWILSHTPAERQTALFSATMPKAIKQIAEKQLKDPIEINIGSANKTAESITQFFWQVNNQEKMATLSRIIQAETHDAMIIFVRTKSLTVDVAEKLQAQGLNADAINGDMAQAARESAVKRLKQGKISYLIATDVAARGLDVERITHVINYDAPFDTESYVHRIGRTGRAGRKGVAILLLTSREKRLLQQIERKTKAKINKLTFPDLAELNLRKRQQFAELIEKCFSQDLTEYEHLINNLSKEHDWPLEKCAAALAYLQQGSTSFALKASAYPQATAKKTNKTRSKQQSTQVGSEKVDFDTCRIEVGSEQGAKKGDIVGAIANECDLDSQFIGKIHIFKNHSLVDLPKAMPKAVLKKLQTIRIAGTAMALSIQQEKKSAKPGPKKMVRKRKTKKPIKDIKQAS